MQECKLIIPKDLQNHVVAWYHHYLQHPGLMHLEETLHSAMYWKDMQKYHPTTGQKVPQLSGEHEAKAQVW